MRRFLNWLRKQKKETIVAAATLLVVLTAGVAVLLNASRLQGIFDPERFERFGNRQEGEDYDSVAGDGLESDLADEDRDGNGRDDEEAQKAVKTEGINPQELTRSDDDEGLGRTAGNSEPTENAERNPDAYEITDNGNGSIGSSGINGPGSADGNNGTVGDAGNAPGSQGGSGDNGEGTKPEPGPGTNPTPGPGTDPTPGHPLSEEEQNQLKPRDPIYTADGEELLYLTAEVNENQKDRIFCVGDAYDPEWVTVRVTVRQKSGAQTERALTYGGSDSYSVSFSTSVPGDRTAIFRYHGLTAAAGYQVLDSYASIRYYAEAEGRIYASALFPGPVDSLVSEEDAAQREKLEEMGNVLYPTAGAMIDLTEYHRWMIAYLGDERIQKSFADSSGTNYKSVTFLETDGEGYLTNMLRGFQYCLSSLLQEDGGPYVRYPATTDWGQVSRALVNVVGAVPEGCKIRREVSGNADNLPEYLGEQVLEKYTGTDPVIRVPMGVTKVDLKEATNGGQVTELQIPESVREIDIKNLVECLPNLKSYSYAEEVSGRNGLKIVDGVLYSADGRTLLSVPPGMTEMPEWASGVTAIAAGAFRGSRITELTVPETVTDFAEGCFADFAGQNVRIHVKGTAAPKPGRAAGTGHKGTVLTQDSVYDTVLKDWMFAFADEEITFGTESGQTGRYKYEKEKKVIVDMGDPTKLCGIPSDTSGFYQAPEGIVSVGAGAFVSCRDLRDIRLPESVERLGADSLILPENAESLTLQGNIAAEISPQAFGDPESGAAVPEITVYVPEELYESYLVQWKAALDPVYGDGTAERLLQKDRGDFLYEDGAKYQRIPGTEEAWRLVRFYDSARISFRAKAGTVEVAENAFTGAEALEIVYLPASVTMVAENAFTACPSLQTVAAETKGLGLDAKELTVGSGAENVRVYEAGGDYEKFIYGEHGEVYGLTPGGAGTLLDVPTDYEGVFVLRENTAALNSEAFSDCARLTGLTGADGALTDIGDACFENCTGLKEVDLSLCTKLKKLGSYLFRSCGSLEELLLPDGLADTGTGLCYGCTSLVRFHAAGLKVLGDEAFAYCSSMRTMDIAGVTRLGARTFMGCSAVTHMALPETLEEMGEECFRDCASLQKIEMNGTLTAISRYAFAGCRDLASVTMSGQQRKALRVIGVQAFADCGALESADFGDCTELQQMGAEAFAGCGYLTRVTLPGTIRRLPDRCFADCGYLSILELLSGTVPELGEQVFGDVLSPYLHLWVQEARVGAYRQAYEALLDQGYGIGTTEKILGAIDPQKEIIRGVTYQMTDEGRVLLEVDPAVSGELTVLQNTVRIADEAFRDCAQLTAIELPDGSRVSLGDRCFAGCSALAEVRLYGDIPQWGTDTFRDCTAIREIELGNSENDQIARVGDGAFRNCTGLTGTAAVTFRAQITSLGAESFSGCSEMGTPSMTTGFRSHLEHIERRAFAGCRSLGVLLNAEYANLKTIGEYAFSDCDSMTQPSVPSGVTSIGEGCFAECDSLQYVSFYCGLEEYPKECFRNCPKLIRTGGTQAAFQSLKRIGEGAYEGCTSLQMPLNPGASTWHLGRYVNLEEIGSNAFRGCDAITQVTVPEAVTAIGANAFAGCGGLQILKFMSAVPPEIGADALADTDSLTEIQVPEGEGVASAYLERLALILGEERARQLLELPADEAAGQSISSAAGGEMSVSESEAEDAQAEDRMTGDTEAENTVSKTEEKGQEISQAEVEE